MAPLDDAFDELAQAVDDLAGFRRNSDDWLNAHDLPMTGAAYDTTLDRLVSDRDEALQRVLDLRKVSA